MTKQTTLRGRATNFDQIHPIRVTSLVVQQLRRSLRTPTVDNLEEAVQPLELVRASSANSRADRDLIVAEDLEEDLAAAAAAVVAAAAMAATAATAAETTAVTAAETTTRATTSSTWRTATARPGTAPATDAS